MAITRDEEAKQAANARLHCARHSGASGPSSELLKRQVKNSGDSWGPDWSVHHRNTATQVALANFIDARLRPEAIAALHTSDRLNCVEFRRRIEAWRIRCGGLHQSGLCPSRRFRKFEYVLALEYGLHPKGARSARLHAHILLYNLHHIRLEDLAREWRELNSIRNPDEPLIEPYLPGPEGIAYCLKTLGTDADQITFSKKLTLPPGGAF